MRADFTCSYQWHTMEKMQFLVYVLYRLLTKLREPQREFRLIGELEIGEW